MPTPAERMLELSGLSSGTPSQLLSSITGDGTPVPYKITSEDASVSVESIYSVSECQSIYSVSECQSINAEASVASLAPAVASVSSSPSSVFVVSASVAICQ